MTTLPIATYRLQFRNGMTFDRAVEILPYLKRLGISHLYASPIFAATSGSTHGYDVVDHNRFDPDLGGEEGFERMHAALVDAGLKLIIDIVPNHMAASLENAWWRSVIEFGRDSEYADHFDIDWSRRLTLPILGGPFEEVLEAGEIRLAVDRKHGCLSLGYFDNLLPINPASYSFVADALPSGSTFSGKEDLLSLNGRLDDEIVRLSENQTFLAALHDRQSWQLTFWKEARRDLSYRRFFEVTGLVGVRVEDEAVFEDVHALILELVRSGKVDGLRVDHVDGLARPTEYLSRLREAIGADKMLLVEKILGPGEKLPDAWGDIGTTGYEFIDTLSGLLVESSGREAMREAYGSFCNKPVDVDEEMRSAKILILRRNFEGELARLVEIARAAASKAGFRLAEEELRDALAEIIVGFNVYRTYGEEGDLSDPDVQVLQRAVGEALTREEADPEAVRFVSSLLHGQHADTTFRQRFQQLTGPVMAKAIEDTLFYRLNPLIALNEVGAAPEGIEGGTDGFHSAMMEDRPVGLLATSTHDTKRGEDARARLYALAEAPELWSEAVSRWRRMNAPLSQTIEGRVVPEPDVEWLIYQALAGIWPSGEAADEAVEALAERFLPYLEKALREAKLRTDWLDEKPEYESAVRSFAERLLRKSDFIDDFTATLQPFIAAGMVNSLSQTLAKLTAPGIPDIYQGSETLDFSLVDPDNRRSIDFEALTSWLNEARKFGELAAQDTEGRLKQQVIAHTLAARREQPALFLEGEYTPLKVRGPLAPYHLAFLRTLDEAAALVVLTRLPLTRSVLTSISETVIELPPGYEGRTFRNIFSGTPVMAGSSLPLERILAQLPVALAFAE